MSKEPPPTLTKIQPETLSPGNYVGRFSEDGQDTPFRVYEDPRIGRMVQFFDEDQGWLPSFCPKYPSEPIILISADPLASELRL